ncbi:hypothetical protein [Paraburkholderia megapolitana]|uniref:hypothetical protein n=1 Tax=Paraburkholderia megapolitana TaxID=420953 RepID=UPI0038BB6659
MSDLSILLNTVEIRLRETMQVFAANQTLNCAAQKDEQLHSLLNANFSFWHACSVGFCSHVIQGMAALTEPRRDSATIQRAIDIVTARFGPNSVPDSVKSDVIRIHQQYKRFRDKLVSHTDVHRTTIADEFDARGFSWNSIGRDLTDLCRAHGTLCQISAGQKTTLPNAEVRTISMSEWISIHTAHDTERVLDALKPALPTLAQPANLPQMLFSEKFEDSV